MRPAPHTAVTAVEAELRRRRRWSLPFLFLLLVVLGVGAAAAGLIEIGTTLAPPDLTKLGFAVRMLGAEGSCTGQALACVVDLQNILRKQAGADVPARVSARMLYEQARLFDEYADDRLPGSSARGAIKGFYHHGVCASELAPYIDGDLSYRLTVDIAKDAKKVTLGSYFRLSHVLNHYHAALSEAKAIYCTAMIHSGWERAAVARHGGRIALPRTGPSMADLRGAHAFAIVGYDCRGFIVMNSWGGFDWAKAYPPPVAGSLPRGPLPGMAHWSYEDWSAHVLDAWVLRLQAPVGLPSGYAGGYRSIAKQELKPGAGITRASEPNLKIVGHYIHVKDGRYSPEPPYASSQEAVEETIHHLTEGDGAGKYDHVVFYAHGGINNLESAVARTAAMVDGFKRNRIWPIFYLWRTGLGEVANDLIARLWDVASERAAGLSDLTDTLIESSSRTLVAPFWREMKADAALNSDMARGGDAWRGLWIDLVRQKARVISLKAELANSEDVDLASLYSAPLPRKTIDDLAAFETRDFQMRLDNYATQRSFLENSLKRTDSELESLKDDQARNTEGLKLQQAAVDRMGNSANKGVVSTSRVDDERRVLAELRSQQGDVQSRLVVAQRNRDELARNIELQDEQHRTQLNENLREATIETEKLAGRLRASGEKLLYTGAVKSQLRHDTEGLDIVVHRMANGRLTEIAATEDTEILPDDVLEVTIRPEQMIGAPDSN